MTKDFTKIDIENICTECGKELKPLCNMKQYEEKTYCVRCYQIIIYPTLLEKLRKQ